MPASKKNRLLLLFSASIILLLLLFALFRDNAKPITLTKAQILLHNRDVKKVVASEKYIYLQTEEGYYKIALSQVTPQLLAHYKVVVVSDSHVVLFIFFVLLFLGLGFSLFKVWQKRKRDSMQPQEKRETTAQTESTSVVEATKSDVSFEDIGGISDVKVELEEIINFMKNPKRYKKFGARMPRGVLLVGPPGVGKTMIAKAVAHESGVPFFYQSAASFVQIYVGMGAKRVHELFLSAKKNAPSIIFIDEIDAVGKKRGGERSDEREGTLNQLLTEMDGFEGSSGVIVIAATNKIEVLDSALLRAGRFDRRIFVELPTKKERLAILEKYLQKVPHQLDVEIVANMTVGFNGAALATLVNEAALLALRQNNPHLSMEHFYSVKEKVLFGKKKLQMLSDKQKAFRITYQSAKVTLATYFDMPFEKLMLSNEKLTPITDEPFIKQELEARVKMLLAGMVACNIKYKEHASSVAYDLNDAKEIVKKMCEKYGMASVLLPDAEEQKILLERLYEETEMLLNALWETVQEIETIFLEQESISKERVKRMLDAVL